MNRPGGQSSSMLMQTDRLVELEALSSFCRKCPIQHPRLFPDLMNFKKIDLFYRVEDNDDLTPIFACQNDTLRETYGDYFLAELIEAQDEENMAIVCEVSF